MADLIIIPNGPLLRWNARPDPSWDATSTARRSNSPGCEGDLVYYSIGVDTDGMFVVVVDHATDPAARLPSLSEAKAWCEACEAELTSARAK